MCYGLSLRPMPKTFFWTKRIDYTAAYESLLGFRVLGLESERDACYDTI
jgi:hypothetical protein